MTKIMFICTGNICRSAMAEAMLKHKLKDEEDLKYRVRVYSSGTFAQNDDTPTSTAIEAMKEYGINMEKHKATNIMSSKILEMDLVLCATTSQRNSVLQLYPELRDKVFTMKEYVGYDETGQDLNIQDPWGYDIEVYRRCAAEIEKCIDILIEKKRGTIN